MLDQQIKRARIALSSKLWLVPNVSTPTFSANPLSIAPYIVTRASAHQFWKRCQAAFLEEAKL